METFLGFLIQLGMVLLALVLVLSPFFFLKRKYKKLDAKKKLIGYGIAIVLFFGYVGIHLGLIELLKGQQDYIYYSVEEIGFDSYFLIAFLFVISPLWMFKTLAQKLFGMLTAFVIVFSLFAYALSGLGKLVDII